MTDSNRSRNGIHERLKVYEGLQTELIALADKLRATYPTDTWPMRGLRGVGKWSMNAREKSMMEEGLRLMAEMLTESEKRRTFAEIVEAAKVEADRRLSTKSAEHDAAPFDVDQWLSLKDATANLILVEWLQRWWKRDEEWRDQQRAQFGPDVAALMRGVADMIEKDATLVSSQRTVKL